MAKLTPELAETVRQICPEALPMQVVRREGNSSYYDYVRPGQPLTDEEIIGISCAQRAGYLDSRCFVEARGLECPQGEEFERKLREIKRNF